MRRNYLMWRLRAIGFACGFGIFLAVIAIAQGPIAADHEHPGGISVREILQWIVIPVIGLGVGVIGYFGRDAYSRLKSEVDEIRRTVTQIKEDLPDRYVQRDDWREEWRRMYETVERLAAKIEARFDRLESEIKMKQDRNNNNHV